MRVGLESKGSGFLLTKSYNKCSVSPKARVLSVFSGIAESDLRQNTTVEKMASSERHGLKPGARVCLVSDSARRGIVESQVGGPYWAVRFVDKSRNIKVTDLKLLSSDAASFEPSQAPHSWEERQREKQASASESSKRGLSVAASTR